MPFKVYRADARHRKDINRLIASAKIGNPIRGPVRNSFFVRVDGKIVAFASMDFIGDNAAAILEGISVAREYRHHGIGSALIQHRIDIARRRGIKTIALATMYYLFNFYKRRGFKTCPRKDLPDTLRNYPMFTAKRYKKCAVMVGTFELTARNTSPYFCAQAWTMFERL